MLCIEEQVSVKQKTSHFLQEFRKAQNSILNNSVLVQSFSASLFLKVLACTYPCRHYSFSVIIYSCYQLYCFLILNLCLWSLLTISVTRSGVLVNEAYCNISTTPQLWFSMVNDRRDHLIDGHNKHYNRKFFSTKTTASNTNLTIRWVHQFYFKLLIMNLTFYVLLTNIVLRNVKYKINDSL